MRLRLLIFGLEISATNERNPHNRNFYLRNIETNEIQGGANCDCDDIDFTGKQIAIANDIDFKC